MAMKPVPKAILIVIAVAVVGFGINMALQTVPTTPTPTVTAVPAVPPIPVVAAPPTIQEPVAPVTAPAQASTGDASSDRGLTALINSGKR